MSGKLVSADRLIQFVENWGKHHGREEASDSFLYAINNAPAVDAVEVVRCFGCKHSDTKQTFEVSNNRLVREYPTVRYCERFDTEVNNSFFCGYGEWRTKNANDTGKSD